MRRCGRTLLGLASTLVCALAARADVTEASAGADTSSEQPYSSIWVRNVFDLKPVPPPPALATTNPPPANVKLLGITTFGNKRAILSVQGSPLPGHPPQKEDTFTFVEGQRHGELEVLEIDPKARMVKIKNQELVSTISFDTNKSTAAAAPSPIPAQPGFAPRPPGFGARPGSSSPFLPPRMVSPPGNTPTGYPTGFAPPGFQPNPGNTGNADETTAALQALRLQQAQQAQEADAAAQAVPVKPNFPRGLGARVTGTYNNPQQ